MTTLRRSLSSIAFFSLLACSSAHTAAARPTSAEMTPRGGWEKLGERTVDGKLDRDRIAVGRDDGRFKSIQIQVEGSSLVLSDIKVTFGNGETFEPKVRLVFDKDSRSRVIDLPGDARVVKNVEFRYGNLPGGGRARVELWAKSS